MPSLLERIAAWWRPSESRLTLKDPALLQLFTGGQTTLAGPIVSAGTAFTCSAFWDGVSQISGDIAKLPLNLHAKRADGRGSDILETSPVHRLMKYRPNAETTSARFRRTLTAHALVYGNAYAEIVRDGLGRPRELWILNPTRVQPFYPEQTARPPTGSRVPLTYRVDGQTILQQRDMFHLRGLSLDEGAIGADVVNVAREAIGLALASSQFASAFFGNGTRFGGILQQDNQDLTEEQKVEIHASLDKLHAKSDKAFRMLLLGMGWKYTETGTSPNDAQMAEIRNQQVQEVARFLDIPLYKLKLALPGAASRASNEVSSLDYYKGPILTWITAWEEELAAKLIFPAEIGTRFFKHNIRGLLRGDAKSQNEALEIMHRRGVISANQWLDLVDMNPQDGPAGDLYFVNGAEVPTSRMDEIIDAQVAPPPAPVLPAAEPADDDDDDDDAADEQQREILAAVEAVEAASAEVAEARAELAAAEVAQADQVTLQALQADVEKLAAVAQYVEADAAERTAQIAALEAARAKDAETVSAVAEAHRALVADVMARCVRMDTDRARRRQATQPKLRTWVTGYADLQIDAYVDLLLPAIRATIAASGSGADARALATQLATDHLSRFRDRMIAVADADPQDYHALLERQLRVWEADEPGHVADRVLAGTV